MDFEEIVKNRYATKKFNFEKIDDKKLNKLFEIIRLSASSMNLQPWKIIVVESQNLKDKLKQFSWNQDQIDSCSHLLIFCARKDLENVLFELEKEMKIHNIEESKIKSFSSMVLNYISNMNENEKLIWAQKQIYIALGNALNGAKALGFDSCPIEGFDPKAYSKLLNLDKNLIPTVVCPIGYADINYKPRPKIRFPINKIFIKI